MSPHTPSGPSLDHTLTTARMVIRRYLPEDAEALYTVVVASRAHIARWLPWTPQHTSIAASLATINDLRAQWQAGVAFSYVLIARAPEQPEQPTGTILGGLGLHPHRPDVPSFEVGYWLAAQAEGHGYMTEAAAALVDYTFAELRARRVEIRCNARNTRSAAVALRLGFAQEGLLRNEQRTHNGDLRDTLVFARVV